MKRILKLSKPLLRVSTVRPLQTTPNRLQCNQGGNVPKKLQRLQKLYQVNNDLPVYLKGGGTDKILYYSTLGLCVVGLIYDFVYFAGYIIP